MSSTDIHPCLTCGVCCQNYRVEFSVYELRSMGGTVPDELAHETGSNRARMNGTQYRPVRCTALGPLPDVGPDCVGCTIYDSRPRPCRDFPFASYGCHDTRAQFGLPPLEEAEVQHWQEAA